MQTLGKGTIVVYVCTKTDSDLLPDVVKTAFRTPESGKYIPKTAVVDAELTEVIAIVPYAGEESERKKLFAEAIKKIRQYAKDRKKRKKKKKGDKKDDG